MSNPENTESMNSEQLGQRLKAVREMFNLSQLYVATKLGVPQGYISRLESGSMSAGFLIKVLEFYSQYISLDRLLNEKVSILECIQEELSAPANELIKNRVALVRGSIDELFDAFKKEQDSRVDEIVKRLHVKMDALDDVK